MLGELVKAIAGTGLTTGLSLPAAGDRHTESAGTAQVSVLRMRETWR
jgi:hypothetical protein